LINTLQRHIVKNPPSCISTEKQQHRRGLRTSLLISRMSAVRPKRSNRFASFVAQRRPWS